MGLKEFFKTKSDNKKITKMDKTFDQKGMGGKTVEPKKQNINPTITDKENIKIVTDLKNLRSKMTNSRDFDSALEDLISKYQDYYVSGDIEVIHGINRLVENCIEKINALILANNRTGIRTCLTKMQQYIVSRTSVDKRYKSSLYVSLIIERDNLQLSKEIDTATQNICLRQKDELKRDYEAATTALERKQVTDQIEALNVKYKNTVDNMNQYQERILMVETALNDLEVCLTMNNDNNSFEGLINDVESALEKARENNYSKDTVSKLRNTQEKLHQAVTSREITVNPTKAVEKEEVKDVDSLFDF